ncbi:biotin transporter BioY [Ructibacterium gallinarum]|uniref:Biotin transporter n=1 Tax=Ructibacterium gallinarum TaxID=2779355 RepID=A0A9D5R960_9FIRM|nr:biotin transporter BioY [Ructibacterium gallinarum]MBE5040149.1 biotin transporter BioY [Ructibacterium gallinarum]
MKRLVLTPQALCMCALFTALIAVGAFIRIPLPVIPFTLQTLFIMLAGLLLGRRGALISCGAYFILGMIGVPIFTQGGGFGYIFKPTFGYLIGFVISAWIIGAVAYYRVQQPSYLRMLMASFAGLAVIYLLGTVYYYFLAVYYMGKTVAVWPLLVSCVFMTLPTDIVSALAAAFLARRLLPWVRRYRVQL